MRSCDIHLCDVDKGNVEEFSVFLHYLDNLNRTLPFESDEGVLFKDDESQLCISFGTDFQLDQYRTCLRERLKEIMGE